ncbi:MFS transporter [Gordonibacter massiliensis (ex Traore et al. 2017)]|uniref:MFS transporter n=1 Tax=Gordonibacter massiliensis (ex Traore et al. 2017) TaxID=1841863 RepID=A0A842JIV4_9ACTN|nr:MFS transporter [Gordonibacter massiliensis (ex Traore et al. 2017)]MBC2889030.1 MFS transporter [Gordonibacter massiliensis (ex Traore et al. 2017)]
MERKKVSGGLVLFMMLMSMTAGAMCLNKVAPIVPVLTESMGLSGAGQAGLLMSVFVFSGIFLAIPSGVIIAKLGYYKTGIIALAAILAGSVVGALDLGYAVMLGSRIVEGVGLILLMTLGPAAVASSFDDKRRGSAMGLLMCFMAFGQIAMFNLAPRIAEAGAWENVWWFTAAYAVVFLVVWVVALRNLDASLAAAGAPSGTEADAAAGPAKLFSKDVFLNKGVWLIGITLMVYLIAEQGVISFLPTYLAEVRGMDAAAASSIVSIAPLVGIPVGIVAGMVSDKMGSRKKPLGVLMLASAVTYALMPTFPTGVFVVLVVLFGIAVMGIVGLCFSAVAELVPPAQGDMAVALLNTFQWVGIFLSSSLVGLLIEAFGWDVMFYLMVPLAVVGAVCTFVTPKLR